MPHVFLVPGNLNFHVFGIFSKYNKLMKILVLYEELAWYFLNCLNVLCSDHKCEILIVRKKINSIAPFNFKFVHPSIKIADRDDYSNESLLEYCGEFKPDFIFLAGWSQEKYLHLIRN